MIRREYIEHCGLGEALLPPIRVGSCEVSLHYQETLDPHAPWPNEPGSFWVVYVCPDGRSGSGSSASSNGFGAVHINDQMVIHGMMPPDAETVEVLVGDRDQIAVQATSGVFIAVVPTGKDITVTFRDLQGMVVAERRVRAEWTVSLHES